MGLVHNYCQKEPLNIVPFKEQVVSKVQTAKLICSMTGAQEQPPHPGSHSDGHLFCMQSDILKSITELLLGLRWTTEGLCLDHLFSAEWCGIGVSAEHSAKQIQGQASWFCKQAHTPWSSPPAGAAVAPIPDKVSPFIRQFCAKQMAPSRVSNTEDKSEKDYLESFIPSVKAKRDVSTKHDTGHLSLHIS